MSSPGCDRYRVRSLSVSAFTAANCPCSVCANGRVHEQSMSATGKRTCKPMEQEENHEKGPRWSWARNQIGNPSLNRIVIAKSEWQLKEQGNVMKIGHYIINSLFVAAGAALSCGSAKATLFNVNLNCGELPSAQGWTYIDSRQPAVPESQVFSTDGNILQMNTLGRGYSDGGYGYDFSIPAFQPGADWEMDCLLAVPKYEGIVSGGSSPGFYIGVQFDNTFMEIGFAGGIWSPQSSTVNIPFDTSGWHDYRFVTDRADNSFSLFADNVLMATGSLMVNSPSGWPDNIIGFGDGSGGANAEADIASFQVFQIPEPSTWAILAAAVGGLSVCRGWFSRRNVQSVS